MILFTFIFKVYAMVVFFVMIMAFLLGIKLI